MSLSVNAQPSAPQDPTLMSQQVESGTGTPEAQVVDRAAQIMALLSGRNVDVNGVSSRAKVGETREIDAPELDEAEVSDDALLEQLVAFLTLESEIEQAKMMEARIKSQMAKLDAQHEETLKKIQEAVDKAVEEAKKAKRNKILGWFMCALAVVAAVVSVVVTAGAAAPGVFAVIACVASCIGAAMSLTTNILDATGVSEKAVKDMAAQYMKDDPGLSESEAMAKAQKKWSIAWGVASAVVAVAGLVGGIGSTVNALRTAKAVKDAMQVINALKDVGGAAYETAVATVNAAKNTISAAMQLTQSILQGLSIAGGAISQGFNIELLILSRDAAKTQAEAKELQKLLDLVQQQLEDMEAELQELLQKIQGVFNAIFEIIDAGNQNANEILMNFQPNV